MNEIRFTKETKTHAIVQGALQRWKGTSITEFLMGTMKLSDTQWLLSHLFESIVGRLNVSNVLSQRMSSKFTLPCEEGQQAFHHFDGIAMELLPKNTVLVELSPLAPIGTNSILARIRQGNVLPTTRMVELVGDIATALSIECAVRHRSAKQSLVQVASSHRVVRVQDFSAIPGFRQHFRMFGLCTSWDKDLVSIQEILFEHASFYLRLLDQLKNGREYLASNITVHVSDITIANRLAERGCIPIEQIRGMTTQDHSRDLCSMSGAGFSRFSRELPKDDIIQLSSLPSVLPIIENLRTIYPWASINFDLGRVAGIGYYNGLCFKIVANNRAGETFPLVDVGSTDWTAKLLHNKKMLCVAGGIGSELFCQKFR